MQPRKGSIPKKKPVIQVIRDQQDKDWASPWSLIHWDPRATSVQQVWRSVSPQWLHVVLRHTDGDLHTWGRVWEWDDWGKEAGGLFLWVCRYSLNLPVFSIEAQPQLSPVTSVQSLSGLTSSPSEISVFCWGGEGAVAPYGGREGRQGIGIKFPYVHISTSCFQTPPHQLLPL